jgi:hypothetical protein
LPAWSALSASVVAALVASSSFFSPSPLCARCFRLRRLPLLFLFFLAPANKMAQSQGILGLPDVVLEQICSQFCPHCVGEDCLGGFELPGGFWGPEYFGALRSLALVKKRIRRRAQPILFHVFCGRRNSLPLLARTLVENPALGAYIRVVRLGDRDKGGNSRCIVREMASLEAIEQLKMLVAPELGAEFDLLCEEGEERLLEPFKKLPPIDDSFFCSPRPDDIVLGVRGNQPPTWASANTEVAKVSLRPLKAGSTPSLCPLTF